jgi:SAM-dependent methyltransferase
MSETASLWDERYCREQYAYGQEPNSFLVSQLTYLPKGKVLSLGEGQGRNAVHLAKQGYAITAVDISTVALQQASRFALAQHTSIQTISADLSTFTIPANQWDVILSIFCHLPADARQALYQQVLNGLHPGGVFLLEAYSPKQLAYATGGPQSAALLAGPDSLLADLCGLEIILAREMERDVNEGLHHHGLASVVQILAVKPFTGTSQ